MTVNRSAARDRNVESTDVSEYLRVNVDEDGRIWWDSSPRKWPAAKVIAEIDTQATILRIRVRRLDALARAIEKQEGRKQGR